MVFDSNGQLTEHTFNGIPQPLRPPTSPGRVIKAYRPGDVFAIVISKITGASPCPKTCRERIAQMNDWGWLKCYRNRKTIATWLAEEARRRGHQISDFVALDLLRAAFRELRQQRPGKPAALPLQNP